VRALAAEERIDWHHAWIPDQDAYVTSIYAPFGRWINDQGANVLLIDPAGTIVARDLHGSAIVEAVEKALKTPSPIL
jgi:hypothetical protein